MNGSLRNESGCPSASGTARNESRERETVMLDIIFVACTVGFFVISLLYVWACDKLK